MTNESHLNGPSIESSHFCSYIHHAMAMAPEMGTSPGRGTTWHAKLVNKHGECQEHLCTAHVM